MIVSEPISHWNNFTVPELKKIMEHSRALERLGIAQDEEMMISIKRDIMLREKKTRAVSHHFEQKPAELEQRRIRMDKKQQHKHLLEQKV